jgi:hypothetical protein
MLKFIFLICLNVGQVFSHTNEGQSSSVCENGVKVLITETHGIEKKEMTLFSIDSPDVKEQLLNLVKEKVKKIRPSSPSTEDLFSNIYKVFISEFKYLISQNSEVENEFLLKAIYNLRFIPHLNSDAKARFAIPAIEIKHSLENSLQLYASVLHELDHILFFSRYSRSRRILTRELEYSAYLREFRFIKAVANVFRLHTLSMPKNLIDSILSDKTSDLYFFVSYGLSPEKLFFKNMLSHPEYLERIRKEEGPLAVEGFLKSLN